MSKNNKNSAAENTEDAVKKAAEAAQEVSENAEKAAETAEENASDVIDLTENAADATENILDLTEDSDEKADEAEEAPEKADEKVAEDEKTEESNEAEGTEKAPVSLREKYHFDLLSKIIIWVVAGVIFLGAVCVTIYYVTTAQKAEFHADCTDTIMWANATAESGHVYDQEFSYACFLPFSTSTIMYPLLHFFGLSMTAHIVGMMCFFVLLTVFLVFMIHEMTGS